MHDSRIAVAGSCFSRPTSIVIDDPVRRVLNSLGEDAYSRDEEGSQERMTTDYEIIQELQMPLPSFRLFALERAIHQGSTPELLSELERMVDVEEHEECRLLCRHAIGAVKTRLRHLTNAPVESYSQEIFWGKFKEANPEDRLTLLSSLTPSQKEIFSETAANLLSSEPHPGVAAFLIRTFSSFWPVSRIEELTEYLLSGNLGIRLAALELFIQKSPASLERLLPRLLVVKDPRIRALAIRGLSAIDPDEAVAHFVLQIAEGDSCEKLAALQISIHLPFNRLKIPLLDFFARETDLSLLQKAGVILASNPDPDVPYRLWEITDAATSEKAKLIKRILPSLCANLKESGILQDEYATFMGKLQEWIYRRTARRFISSALEALETDRFSEIELHIQLQRSFDRPFIRETCIEALDWPISDIGRSVLQRVLENKNPEEHAKSETSSTPPSAGTPSTPLPSSSPSVVSAAGDQNSFSSIDEQIRSLALWPPEENERLATRIRELLKDPSTPIPLKGACFRAALRISRGEFVEEATAALQKGTQELVPSCLEYLGSYDSDTLFLHLGRFLTSDRPRIKIAALRILQEKDPAQALSAIRLMLRKTDVSQHQAALACLVQFDFSSVRDLLADFLIEYSDSPHLNSALCLFQANIDFENMYSLFRVEQVVPAHIADAVKHTRRSIGEILVRDKRLTAKEIFDLESAFARRYSEEKQKRQAEKKPYAVAVLHPSSVTVANEVSAYLQEVWRRLWEQYRLYAVGFGIFAILYIFVIHGFFRESAAVPNKRYVGAIARGPISLEGIIRSADRKEGTFIFDAKDGHRYFVLTPTLKTSGIRAGASIRTVVIPVRIDPEGTIVAHLLSIAIGG
ncbi:MAG: hypothetical protein WA705_28295 [Candidatus Ozemobacteraceae bacterium]